MEIEILKYLYDNFELGDVWEESFGEIMKTIPFLGKTKKEIRFFLRKMESEGFLKTYKFQNDEFLTATLKGFLYYEENLTKKNRTYTDLLIKFLKFVKDIDDGIRT